MTKMYNISKQKVMDAWRSVRSNKGSAGIDEKSLEDFEKDIQGNLYRIWNRMSSGSYFPPPVKAVDIPKAGGTRRLGIPTVADRVAQTLVKMTLEPVLEPCFHEDSYGYRPNKSAHQAILVTRKRCWKYDWMVEFDVRAMFDSIPHDLILKALTHHTKEKWILIYCERWLKADMINAEGQKEARTKGTPQGGVVSPLLMNLFMHYGFDLWMQRTFPQNPWVRYADDACIHSHSLEQSKEILEKLSLRLKDLGLEIHPNKTHIVYCRDGRRTGTHQPTKFDFLGFEFKMRSAKFKNRPVFLGYLPAVSPIKLKGMRRLIKYKLKIRYRVDLSIEQIAAWINPIVRGWANYYGLSYKKALDPLWNYLNDTLARWASRKFKTLNRGRTNAYKFLKSVYANHPSLFFHWKFIHP